MRGGLKSTTCWNTNLLHSFPFFGYVYCVACFWVIFISIIYISTEGLHKNIPMIQYIKRVIKSGLVSLWSICIFYTASDVAAYLCFVWGKQLERLALIGNVKLIMQHLCLIDSNYVCVIDCDWCWYFCSCYTHLIQRLIKQKF